MTSAVVPDRTSVRLALRGDLLDFTAAPRWADTDLHGVRYRADHWLLVEGGRIVGARPGAQRRRDHRLNAPRTA